MKRPKKKMGRPRSVIPLKKLTLSIPEEIWEKWKIQAVREKTTMSQLAVRLLTEYMNRKKGS